jgi:hypothetical protein
MEPANEAAPLKTAKPGAGKFFDVVIGSDFSRGKLYLTGMTKVCDIIHVITSRTVDLEDLHVRQALINQGWTPPP